MAKVTGPLFSVSASGKIADAMVHFGWKGINVVRQWVIPSNPQSAVQGNVRTIIGNLGRACGFVSPGKRFATKLSALGVIPDAQTKQSYLVKYIKDTFMGGSGATMKTNYSAKLAAFKAHTQSAAFKAGATSLALIAFNSSYDNLASWDAGLGMYLIAETAIALNFTGAPYTTALASWTATEVGLLVTHMRTLV